MAKQRYTTTQLIEAIRGTYGIKTAVAQALGCTRQTVDNYIGRYPTVESAYEEEREKLLDLAESKFAEQIAAGEWPAIRFALATLGKQRGYSEKLDVEGQLDLTSGGKPLKPDFSEMSDDELRAALSRHPEGGTSGP